MTSASWSQSMRISTTRCTCPDVSPWCERAPGERDQYQASPVSRLRVSASSFMWATISTSRDTTSMATTVTRPSGPNRGLRVDPSSVPATSAAELMGRLALAAPDQRMEAQLLGRIRLEASREASRDRRDAALLDAAHGHAHVLGFHHHGEAAGLQMIVHRGHDLGGQVLLGLQAARIDVDDAGELRQPDHPFARIIGHMRLAE